LVRGTVIRNPGAQRMNEFRLFAHGPGFDADAYLVSAPLSFDGVWHKGESGPDHPKSNGVFKVLGTAGKSRCTNNCRLPSSFSRPIATR
jgi:hypothetical protein